MPPLDQAMAVAPRPSVRTSRPQRITVIGPGFRFLSGLSVYTCSLANALADAHDVSVVLLDRLIPERLYPGGHRVGPSHQPHPDRSGEGGEDDVVDRAAMHAPDLAVVLQGGAHEHDPALGRGLGVEQRILGRASAGEDAPRLLARSGASRMGNRWACCDVLRFAQGGDRQR